MSWSFILLLVLVSLTTQAIHALIYRTPSKPVAATPDPIEVEARRLAEIEVEELCRLLEGNFEPIENNNQFSVPVSELNLMHQIGQHLTSPIEQMNGAASVVPIMMQGPARELANFRCLCTGCGEWHNDPASHVHVYNAMGDVVFSYLENRNKYA